MFRFLLGVVVGSIATALYLDSGRAKSSVASGGRVDELAGAGDNLAAKPELNAGDGTPSQAHHART